MSRPKKNDFAPWKYTSPGFEAVYTGETDLSKKDCSDSDISFGEDKDGNVFMKYSMWGFCYSNEGKWNDEIRYINRLQEKLGKLSNDIRRIRVQIASLQCCDNGVPVTIDEILNGIGMGKFTQPTFHPGCWLSMGSRTTQPRQKECMVMIENILKTYLKGKAKDSLINKYPAAKGLIDRTYKWLGPFEKFSELQQLMLKRMLLPFEFLSKRNENYQAVHQICYGPDGKGKKIDKKIAELAGLPPIFAQGRPEYKENMAKIKKADKKKLYEICGMLAHGLHGLSDCHHSTFRWLETWIYAIGRFSTAIPTRRHGTEGERIGQLLFGYALGLDLWLQGVPMQFALLDLGHLDLGFNPKNEILRVFAYLGEKNPTKEWLAACLWFSLVLEPPASLFHWGWRHKKLLENTKSKGITIDCWMKLDIGNLGRR